MKYLLLLMLFVAGVGIGVSLSQAFPEPITHGKWYYLAAMGGFLFTAGCCVFIANGLLKTNE